MQYDRNEAQRYMATRNGVLDSSDRVREILQEYAICSDHKGAVLDMGCGPGFYAKCLRQVTDQRIAIHALDHSLAMLALAQEGCVGLHNMHFCIADVCAIPYSDNTFAMCFAVNLVHQIRDLAAVFREVSRVLTLGGFFVLVTPSREKLCEFALFAANPALAESQEQLLPQVEEILAAGRTSPLVVKTTHPFRGQGTISSSELLQLIKRRFLSILRGGQDAMIDAYALNTERYINVSRVSAISPYWSDLYVMRKENTNGKTHGTE